MESSKKVAFFIVFLVTLISCNSQNRKGLDLPTNLHKDSVGNIVFRVKDYEKRLTKGMYLKNDSINFTHVFCEKSNNYIKNNGTIDYSTFRNIFSISSNLNKIITQNNLEYFKDIYNLNNYYEDKNNLYIYNTTKSMFIVLKNKNYEVLGGNYLKHGNDIYSSGDKLENVDIKTFISIQILDLDDGYNKNLGMDKDHIFLGSSVMDYKSFKRFLWTSFDKKELENKYFKIKKQ